MPFVPTPLGVRVSVEMLYGGEEVVNVWHVRAANPSDGFSLAAIADIFVDTYIDTFLPNLNNALSLVQVVCTDISQEGGQQSVQVVSPPAIGGQNSEGMPANVAFVVTHRTARTGRSYRGRTYFPGMSEGLVAGNFVLPAVVTNLSNGCNTLRERLAASSFVLAVLSLYNQGAPRTQGVLTPIIASVARDNRVDSQRRRLP